MMERQEFIVVERAMVATLRSGDEVHGENVWSRLATQCRQRAPLFAPARERAELHRAANDLLGVN